MTNAELIAALRVEPFEVGSFGLARIMNQAADLIEAQAKRIEKLEAQMPKDGEWIDDNGAKVPIDRDGYTTGMCRCSVCGDWLIASDEYEVRGRYCPNCGSRMRKGEQE